MKLYNLCIKDQIKLMIEDRENHLTYLDEKYKDDPENEMYFFRVHDTAFSLAYWRRKLKEHS